MLEPRICRRRVLLKRAKFERTTRTYRRISRDIDSAYFSRTPRTLSAGFGVIGGIVGMICG